MYTAHRQGVSAFEYKYAKNYTTTSKRKHTTSTARKSHRKPACTKENAYRLQWYKPITTAFTFFTEFRQSRNGVALEVQEAVGISADFVAQQEALQRRVEDVGTL